MGVMKLRFYSALESFCYDSPDRQTFVMEGWFAAGDFLQGKREIIQHLLKPEVLMCNKWFHCFSVVCLSFSQCCHGISMKQERLQQSEVPTAQTDILVLTFCQLTPISPTNYCMTANWSRVQLVTHKGTWMRLCKLKCLKSELIFISTYFET